MKHTTVVAVILFFAKRGYGHIVIPHHKPIKAIYVKQVLEILESEQ